MKETVLLLANNSTNRSPKCSQTKMLNCWTQGNMQVTWLEPWETEDLNAEDLKYAQYRKNVSLKISWTPPVLRTQICYLCPFDFIAVGYKNMTWKGVIFFYWKFNKSIIEVFIMVLNICANLTALPNPVQLTVFLFLWGAQRCTPHIRFGSGQPRELDSLL